MVQLSFLIFLTRVRLRIFLCLSYLYLGPRHFDDPGVLGAAAGPATLFAIPPQGLQPCRSNPAMARLCLLSLGAGGEILVLSSDPCLHERLPATRSADRVRVIA